MGALGGLLGLSGGAMGSGFAAPAQANIATGVNTQQTGAAYGQNQQALQQQQSLLNAIQAQGGLANQNQVYGQGNQLLGQLQGVASGQGSPAQAMLNQQTGENVANQAALMAGQRGSSANVGLLARQAAQQGAATQQQAVGQGATLQAQQSLGALGQMQGLLGQQAGIANTQAANQIGATGAVTGAQQSEQSNLLNALAGLNTAQVGSQGSVNAGNVGLANTTMQGQQALIGGGLNSLGGGMAGGGGKARGGVVNYDDGGDVAPTAPGSSSGLGSLGPSPDAAMTPTAPGSSSGLGSLGPAPAQNTNGPASSFGQFLAGVKGGGSAPSTSVQTGSDAGAGALFAGASSFSPGQKLSQVQSGASSAMQMLPMLAAAANKGGLVDVALSPGEKVIEPENVPAAAQGKIIAKTVPGKAKVPGDSLKNDTFKTRAKEGAVIVPRTSSKDNKKSADFVKKTLAKRRGK